MIQEVDTAEIEQIVGKKRSRYEHWGRIVPVGGGFRFYILHSLVCIGIYQDLRLCPFSKGLDNVIPSDDWETDVPTRLRLVNDRLVHA